MRFSGTHDREASSSSNTSPSPCSYHVFLSFRGADTRKAFTDHLNTVLKNAGFQTFRDDDELVKGEDIKPGFQKAIQQSRSSVIVFSKNYASSRWCLDELVMIMERKRMSGHVVLPVFYDLDPSHVRNQTGSLEGAFAQHEEKYPLDKVNGWRKALAEVADLSGMVLQNQDDGHEAKFIQKIVKTIEDKLRRMPLSVAPYPVGIHIRAEKINLWLQDGSNDVGMMVIHGIPGSGKTTIAQYAYYSNISRFEGGSFLENIRDFSEQPHGLVQLQKKLLQDIFMRKKVEIDGVNEGLVKIADAISSTRVLLVLDGADHMDQVDAILTNRDQFHPGSKIIITTTHAGLLKADHHRVTKMHNLEALDYEDSLELFSWYAFGQSHPVEGYLEHSKTVVHHTHRLPIALKVLGSSLAGQTIEVWESALEKLKAIPDGEIQKKLRISYDCLKDDYDRDIFLDAACFFSGMDKDYAAEILKACGFFADVGIQNLIDRCLISIDEQNKVQMHHMIRDMGREIVRQQSNQPMKRSRLWSDKDVLKVLAEKNGTETIEGLALNLPTHQTYDCPSRNVNERVVETDAFATMGNLRLLKLSGVQLSGSYEQFPKGLRWLSWTEFPFNSIPDDFPMDNVAVLEVCRSRLKQILKGKRHFPNLKILDLSHSHLTEIVDFSAVPYLERLVLEACKSLVEIHTSIGMSENLKYLDLSYCTKLEQLPMLPQSLETLNISGCLNLERIPNIMQLESLKVFEADNVPAAHKLITPILSLPLLGHLSLKNCGLTADHFPRSFGSQPQLQTLSLDHNPFCSLPDFIRDLTGLRKLSFRDCTSLTSLVQLPRVEELDTMGCISLETLTSQSISCMPSCYQYSDYSNSKLVEIGYYYKLEPIRMISAEMLNFLGLMCNFKSMDAIMMRRQPMLFPHMNVKENQPIQGLYEFGIFSTFFPGNKVPGHFSHKSALGSISFTVSSLRPNHRIRGLNIFAVYTTSCCDDKWYPLIVISVHNKSKGQKWIYGPSWLGVPGEGKDEAIRLRRSQFGKRLMPPGNHEEISGKEKDMAWLSHWELGKQLESGDEVVVSVRIRSQFMLSVPNTTPRILVIHM